MAKNKEDKTIETKPEKLTLVFKKKFKGCFNNFEINAKPGDSIEVPDIIYNWIKQFNVC